VQTLVFFHRSFRQCTVVAGDRTAIDAFGGEALLKFRHIGTGRTNIEEVHKFVRIDAGGVRGCGRGGRQWRDARTGHRERRDGEHVARITAVIRHRDSAVAVRAIGERVERNAVVALGRRRARGSSNPPL